MFRICIYFEAQLLENAYSCPRAILISNVGQTDLVLVCSKSVDVRLHVFVCSSYDLCHPG